MAGDLLLTGRQVREQNRNVAQSLCSCNSLASCTSDCGDDQALCSLNGERCECVCINIQTEDGLIADAKDACLLSHRYAVFASPDPQDDRLHELFFDAVIMYNVTGFKWRRWRLWQLSLSLSVKYLASRSAVQ